MMKKALATLFGVSTLLLAVYMLTPTPKLFELMISAERHMAGLELKQVRVNELNVAYLKGGSGEPLVLLHGFGADKDNWNRIAAHLTDHFEVFAIDIPGFGDSSADISLDYDVLSQTARIDEILSALELNKVHLAGSSMGGYIAGNYAAIYPKKVSQLWLISPFGVKGVENSDMFLSIKAGKNPVVLPRTEPDFLELFDYLFVKPPFVPQPIITHLAKQAESRVPLNSKIFTQIHRLENGRPQPDSPLEDALTTYIGPVLVTWGTQDRILHVSAADTLKQTMPHATLNLMTDVGHLPMMEKPQAAADAFLSFSSVQ
ncbi:alpha/beta fold hydrolase [Shewanella waksmanii]|uniref:alpha/beta fold hydrolase n=1 Tax=Shewanella waksmanii TaxID=213783 RepID=UPI00048ED236|nr:alpha/beta fold hydrolase [Shewanella waksmanii]